LNFPDANDLPQESSNDYFSDLCKLHGDYAKYKGDITAAFEKVDPERSALMLQIARLTQFIDEYAEKKNLHVRGENLQEFSDNFRQARGLLTVEVTKQWFDENDIDVDDYEKIMTTACRIDFLVTRHNLDVLNNVCSLNSAR